MEYRLEHLGPHEFEHLAQALLLKIYGPTVGVFGPGRDSGRDATFEGHAKPVELPGALAPAWAGYHVFQAKFHERPRSTAADTLWLQQQIRRELAMWTNSSNGRKGPKPEYLVFITNVSLGGAVGGGLEKTSNIIREVAARQGWPLKDCAIWDRSKVERLLDGFADVRQAFNALITPGDVLAAASLEKMTGLGGRVEAIRPVLEEYARTELIARGKVSLGEAGQIANQRLELAQVAIDLPARYEDELDPSAAFRVLDHLVAAGNHVLRRSVARQEAQPHFLIMGGPGQGKTTLGRMLAQIYRAALLSGRDGLSEQARAACTATLARAREIGVAAPRALRWPMTVDLAEYADRTSGGGLLTYIAARLEATTGETLHPRDVRAWLGAWPWLLVLDGFDEVASKHTRDAVAAEVHTFLEQAHTVDADLLVVATSRPQGYGDELPPELRKVRLLHLTRKQAIEYATRVTNLRMGDDPDKHAVLRRIADATTNDLTWRIMRTPLQVMIMSLLLERRSKPPQDRAALFSDYYDVVYDREVQKKNYLATVLAEHRPDIDAIHHTTGLRLQAASESSGGAEALMSSQSFEEVVRAQLTGQGFEGAELERLVRDLMRAAQDRLVLVTARGRDQVGFELRSIQEFMAARALVNELDTEVIERLRVLAPAAHWRNTWLLAVGAIYRTRAPLFDEFLHMLRDLDASETFGLIIETAPRLAIEILDDGMASKSPKHLRVLVELALKCLSGPNLGAARLGDVLAEVGDNDAVRLRVTSTLQRALQGPPDERAAASAVLDRLSAKDLVGPLATRARQLRSAKSATGDAPALQSLRAPLSGALPESAREWPPTSPEGRFVRALRKVKVAVSPDGEVHAPGDSNALQAAAEVLTSDDALGRVAEALEDVDPEDWPARSAIVSFLWRARERTAVAHRLQL